MNLRVALLDPTSSTAGFADAMKKRKEQDYTLRRQFDKKPSTILGCPTMMLMNVMCTSIAHVWCWKPAKHCASRRAGR